MSGVGDGKGLTLSETEVIGAGQYRHSLSKEKQHHTKYVLERTHIYAHTYSTYEPALYNQHCVAVL